MRAYSKITGLLVATILGVGELHGQTSFQQSVTIVVPPTSIIAVSGDPEPLVVDRKASGSETIAADASTSYSLTTNVAGLIIEAGIDRNMPAGTELWLTAGSRLGRSEGRVRLEYGGRSTLVTAIGQGVENGRPLTLEFVVREGVDSVPLQSRRVHLVVVDVGSGRRDEAFQSVVFGVNAPGEPEPIP